MGDWLDGGHDSRPYWASVRAVERVRSGSVRMKPLRSDSGVGRSSMARQPPG